jgi:RHS repeat-associated protein
MSGGANNSRLTSMTYPNGKVLNYNYGTAGGLNDTISRLDSLSDSSGTLEQYTYLGLDTVVKRAHPQPGVDLTYIKQSGESNGDASDQYTGLDRFGRVVDQRWINTGTNTATDRFQYGYDRDSNALYRNNLVNTAFGELYHASGAGNGYDGLNQLSGFLRGVLSASQQNGPLDTITSPSSTESWSPDALGNFSSITTNGNTQTRTANQQNEITSISGATTPTYDTNGNLTTDELGQTYKYDAWNRLVQVKNSAGTTIASYVYDALGRRVQETHSGTVNDLYYSSAWQVLEERTGGVSTATLQYVWSSVYVDALVLRDRSTQNNGTLNERLWVQQDTNWNLTALVNRSGSVVERYIYDPYGQVTYLNGSWSTISNSAYAWIYGFQGLRADTATGNLHAAERDLRPTMQRWVELDPLRIGGGDTNLYRAEGDNPTNATDPSGFVGLRLGRDGNGWSSDPSKSSFQVNAPPSPDEPTPVPPSTFWGTVYHWWRTAENWGDNRLTDGVGIIDKISGGKLAPWLAERPTPPTAAESQYPLYGPIRNADYHLSQKEVGWYAFYVLLAGFQGGMLYAGFAGLWSAGTLPWAATPSFQLAGGGSLGGVLASEGAIGLASAMLSGGVLVASSRIPQPGSGAGDGTGQQRGIGGRGWRGDQNWRNAVRDVERGGTIEDLGGQVPSKQEALDLINEAKGTVDRIEGPHAAPNPHQYPHINYTTASGAKGTIQIK